MSTKNRIVVLDKNRKVLQNLLENDGLSDVLISEKINGESTLTFRMPKINEKFKSLYEIDVTLLADGKEYTLMTENAITISKSLDDVTYAEVNAVETWYLLNKNYITAYNSKMLLKGVAYSMVSLLSKSPEQLVVNDKVVTSRFPLGSAGYALEAVLWDSGWTVLFADDTGQLYDLITDKKTILENIMEIQRLWGGMLFWDSSNKTVSLRSEKAYQPTNGFQVRYKYNLQEITRQQNNDVVTRLIPRGNNYLNIDKVNNGVGYLEDYTYSSKLYVKEVQNPDIYDQTVLLNWGKQQLEILSKPRYQYTVTTLDLNKLKNEKSKEIVLGHMVDIVDSDVVAQKIDEQKRVISYSYDMFNPVRCQIEIGDKIGNFEEMFRDLTRKVAKSDSIISSDGKISGDNLDFTGNEDYDNIIEDYESFRGEYSSFKKETTTNYIKLETHFTNEIIDTKASITLLSDETQSKITTLTNYTNQQLQTTTSTLRTEISNSQQASITQSTNYTNQQLNYTTSTLRQEISNSYQASISQSTNYTNQQLGYTASTLRIEISNAQQAAIKSATEYRYYPAGGGSSKTVSEILQTSNQYGSAISLVVTNATSGYPRVNSASIVASVNDSGSSVMISADKITLSGKTTFISNVVNGINYGSTTINGGKITTNSITANQISSRTITSDKIAANTITAYNIASRTITANNIAAGSISSYEISSSYVYTGTLRADQIRSGRISSDFIDAKALFSAGLSAGYLRVMGDVDVSWLSIYKGMYFLGERIGWKYISVGGNVFRFLG